MARYTKAANTFGGEIAANGGLTVGAGTNLGVTDGGSTSISTGAGSVKMTTGTAGTNACWIPIEYGGTTYYIPAWTTHAPS